MSPHFKEILLKQWLSKRSKRINLKIDSLTKLLDFGLDFASYEFGIDLIIVFTCCTMGAFPWRNLFEHDKPSLLDELNDENN